MKEWVALIVVVLCLGRVRQKTDPAGNDVVHISHVELGRLF